MIISLVKPFGSMLKVKRINIYDTVFAIHTKLTVVFLLIFSIIVCAHENFGQPINCILEDAAIRLFVETNCWVHGTFIYRNITQSINGRENWEQVPEFQKYYQWVAVILLFQAALFYIPAFMWKTWERGRIMQLCSDLGSPIISEEHQKQKNQIIGYLRIDQSRVHRIYIVHFVICEIMNFLIVILNMSILNGIFKQFWTRYFPVVSALFATDGESFSNLSSELFPKLAKCTYFDIGPSGSQQKHDTLCLLSLNILNDKIFAFIYVWYIFLLLASVCNLIARSIILISPRLRLKMIRSLAAMSSVPLTERQMKLVLHGDNTGDWFILFLLGRNLNPIVFREILVEIANHKEESHEDVNMNLK